MKTIFYFILLLAAATSGQAQTNNNMAPSKPVTCKLTTPELQKRKATVIAELKALLITRQELPNGYRYEFTSTDKNLDMLNSFIKTERMCCDFLIFQVTVEENKATLAITGPEGTKAFLQEEVDL